MNLISTYVRALREEPKTRAYLLASLVDDTGVAISGWAAVLLMSRLFTDQRARASVMLPSLLCFLVGALVAGPLADWEQATARIGAYRWRLVVWGRLIETGGLFSIVASAARGMTLKNVLPYMLLSALMKTSLGPTREAFFVDLLRREEIRVDRDGTPMLDERGEPLRIKAHLLTMESLRQALRQGSALLGLAIGGTVVAAVRGRIEVLFALDVVTNLAFVALVLKRCHPDLPPAQVRLSALWSGGTRALGVLRVLGPGVRHLATSARDLARYLREPTVRPLLWFLFADWLVEVLDEFYSGDMMVQHVLGGSDEALRYANLLWSLATVGALVAVPLLSRRVGGLGRVFLAVMLLDGLVMIVAGHLALGRSAAALVPFVGVLALDRALTATSGTLSALATASSSSAALRGRIFAVVPVLAILGDIVAEGLSTPIAEKYGEAAMLRGLGVAQIGLMLGVTVVGGAALLRYGVRSVAPDPYCAAAIPPLRGSVAAESRA